MFATSLAPAPIERLKQRPPTRPRASRTITERPAPRIVRAAVRPARPAPTTAISAVCVVLGAGLRGARFFGLPLAASAAAGTASAAPVTAVPATKRRRVIGLGGSSSWSSVISARVSSSMAGSGSPGRTRRPPLGRSLRDLSRDRARPAPRPRTPAPPPRAGRGRGRVRAGSRPRTRRHIRWCRRRRPVNAGTCSAPSRWTISTPSAPVVAATHPTPRSSSARQPDSSSSAPVSPMTCSSLGSR